jgi:hypothetical protein
MTGFYNEHVEMFSKFTVFLKTITFINCLCISIFFSPNASVSYLGTIPSENEEIFFLNGGGNSTEEIFINGGSPLLLNLGYKKKTFREEFS